VIYLHRPSDKEVFGALERLCGGYDARPRDASGHVPPERFAVAYYLDETSLVVLCAVSERPLFYLEIAPSQVRVFCDGFVTGRGSLVADIDAPFCNALALGFAEELSRLLVAKP